MEKSKKTTDKYEPARTKLKNFAKSTQKYILDKRNLGTIIRVAIVLLAGLAAMFFIFVRQYGGMEAAQEFLDEHPEIAGYSALIMTLISIIFFGIFGNAIWSSGALFIVSIIVMFVNEEKMRSREAPFMLEDLAMTSEAGSLADMVDWANFWRNIALIALVLLACFLLNWLLKKLPAHKLNIRYKILAQIIIVATGLILLGRHTDFLRTELTPDRGTTIRVDWLDSTIDFTNAPYNFESNGFIVGTITSLQKNIQREPADYSRQKIDEIVKKYSEIAANENQNRAKISDEKINVIYVMSESFIDPENIKKVYDFQGDPIAFTRSIIGKYSSGQTAVAEYGGGTANVEFEALTGLSNYFINAIPYTVVIPGNRAVPSIAKTFKQNGYRATAIHPYANTMYKRNTNYPLLGFDEFIDREKISDKSSVHADGRYISDEAAFNQVLSTLKDSEQADFVHLVTMQNHMPYDKTNYDKLNYPVKNISGNDEEARRWEVYLEGISRSDAAMKNFLAQIDKLGEKTIVAFWGDHWPGIAGAFDQNDPANSFLQNTPLFIYSNFASEKHNINTISLNYLQVNVLAEAHAKISPFQQLLSESAKTNPALTKKQNITQNEALRDYELIEYDILSGKKYSAESNEFFGY